MYKIIDLEQNSPEWHEYRRSHIGASDAPIIMGSSPWKSGNELWKEKMGFADPPKMTAKMQRGHDLEPIARNLVSELLSIDFTPKVFESSEYPFLSASVDGVNEDTTILLEIKCPNRDTHVWACEGHIKDYYRHQIQHQLFVTGAKKCVYFSYRPECAQQIGYFYVFPDKEIMAELMIKYGIFWSCILNATEFEPPMVFDKF